jgi:hypothetical protein
MAACVVRNTQLRSGQVVEQEKTERGARDKATATENAQNPKGFREHNSQLSFEHLT